MPPAGALPPIFGVPEPPIALLASESHFSSLRSSDGEEKEAGVGDMSE